MKGVTCVCLGMPSTLAVDAGLWWLATFDQAYLNATPHSLT
jgi:hypothetical protein